MDKSSRKSMNRAPPIDSRGHKQSLKTPLVGAKFSKISNKEPWIFDLASTSFMNAYKTPNSSLITKQSVNNATKAKKFSKKTQNFNSPSKLSEKSAVNSRVFSVTSSKSTPINKLATSKISSIFLEGVFWRKIAGPFHDQNSERSPLSLGPQKFWYKNHMQRRQPLQAVQKFLHEHKVDFFPYMRQEDRTLKVFIKGFLPEISER